MKLQKPEAGNTGIFAQIKSLFAGQKSVQSTGQIDELTVIFFTDGCDTCNQKPALLQSLHEMSAALQSIPGLNSKFLAIGFSQGHDAAFMNDLAKAGSMIGNFIYVDQSKAGWQQQVNTALKESLEIAISNSSPFNFNFENHAISFSLKIAGEMTYVFADTEEQEETKGPTDDKIERV